MNKLWSDEAWEQYLYWQTQDKKTLKRINQLLRDIERGGTGLGKAERLVGEFSGCMSRRIDEKNRIIYRIKDGNLEILICAGHYGDK